MKARYAAGPTHCSQPALVRPKATQLGVRSRLDPYCRGGHSRCEYIERADLRTCQQRWIQRQAA